MLSSWPACPFTHSHVMSWPAVAASSSCHKSWFKISLVPESPFFRLRHPCAFHCGSHSVIPLRTYWESVITVTEQDSLRAFKPSMTAGNSIRLWWTFPHSQTVPFCFLRTAKCKPNRQVLDYQARAVTD